MIKPIKPTNYAEPTYGQYLQFLTTLREGMEERKLSEYICNALAYNTSYKREMLDDDDCEYKLRNTVYRTMQSNSRKYNITDSICLYYPYHNNLTVFEHLLDPDGYTTPEWTRATRIYYLTKLIAIYSAKYRNVHGVEWTSEKKVSI